MPDDTFPTDPIPSSLAADLLGISTQALSQWRAGGVGPKAHLRHGFGGMTFFYSRREVLEHLRGRLCIEDRITRLEDRLERLELKGGAA